VCALDFDVDALSTARILYPGLAACAGRAEAPPFAASVFDGVVCIDVLHWCADATAFEAAWKGAWEALRPGGIFFARLRMRGEGSEPGEGWFLADRKMLEGMAARDGGEWLLTLTRDGDSVVFLLRKP
jgi:SAM-dependent methyltransferase